jgi:hypothetical protein
MTQDRVQPVKVFISYSWSSTEHVEWVLELAKKLVTDGVDVVIDRWDLKPGQDKYHFMESMVKDEAITKVLVICDKAYAHKADDRAGGVGTETQIISREVYDKVSQEKFLPIIKEKEETGKPFIPVFLQSRIYIDLSNPQTFYENYEELLRNIYNAPLYTKPPLGEPPAFITTQDKSPLRTTHRLQSFKDAVLRNQGFATGLAEDYLKALINSFADFELNQKPNEPFDETVWTSIEEFKPCRDEFIDFMFFISKYCSDIRLFEATQNFFSETLQFVKPDNSYDRKRDNYKFIVYELFLYMLATLIKHERFTESNIFLQRFYFYRDEADSYRSERNLFDFTTFRRHVYSLEEDRKRRLNLNQYHLTATLVHQRADNDNIIFADLAEADYILFLRSLLSPIKDDWMWYPYTFVFVHRSGTMPLFLKATSKAFFQKLKLLLGVDSKAQLIERFNKLAASNTFREMRFIWGGEAETHRTCMNLDKLDTV